MIRKALTLLLLTSALTWCTVVGISSCEPIYYDTYVAEVFFYGGNGFNYNRVADTTVFSDTALFAVQAAGKEACCYRPGIPFISSCYAVARKPRWKNGLQLSSFNLSFDRDVKIDSHMVAAHVNLLTDPVFHQYAEFKKTDNKWECTYNLEIKESLLKRMSFDTIPYKASFSCITTTEPNVFTKELVVIFKR